MWEEEEKMRLNLSLGGGWTGFGHKRETRDHANADSRLLRIDREAVDISRHEENAGHTFPALSASFVALSALIISFMTSVGSTIWDSFLSKFALLFQILPT